MSLIIHTTFQAFILCKDKVKKFAKLREAILACEKMCVTSLGQSSFIRDTPAAIASAGPNSDVPLSQALHEKLMH